MNILLRFSITGMALAVSACATAPKPMPVFSESFVAVVTDQGLKQFRYSYTLGTEGDPPGMGRRGPPPGGPSGGARGPGPLSTGPAPGMDREQVNKVRKRMEQNPEAIATERIQQHLQETKFCVDGYFVLNKEIDPSHGNILAECKSAADD